LDENLPAITQYLRENPELYDLVNAKPDAPGIREKVLNLAYGNVKLKKQLNEYAKITSEKDTKVINDSKTGLKMQSGVGGSGSGTPKKQDDLDKVFGQKAESTGIFG
jgi:hypothetical protein